MSEYVLDVSKWRCGGDNGIDRLGDGDTALLNREGFMCCLGQFAKHIGVPDERLLGRTRPIEIHLQKLQEIDAISTEPYDSAMIHHDDECMTDSLLACKLVYINDQALTTHQVKIERIRIALEEHGHSLKVINGEDND